MKIHTFINNARQQLDSVLDKPGGILYSSVKTLKPGDIYLMGHNPGGESGPTIAEDLEALPNKNNNDYLDTSWVNQANKNVQKGLLPLQKRVKWLIQALGYEIESICSSNLIFVKSRESSGVDLYKYGDLCWPIHEMILDIVNPKLMLVFGNSDNSPYRYLHKRFYKGNEETGLCGHGNWRYKGFPAAINKHGLYIASVPHLSRYHPIGKSHVVNWLKSNIS